jgi:hypothetical protein
MRYSSLSVPERNRDMRFTIGMKLTLVAAVGLMSLPWIVPVPVDPPPADSAVVLVTEQPAPVHYDCPFM